MTHASDPVCAIEAALVAGDELARAGQHQAAIEHYRRLIEHFPQSARAWLAYGSALDRAGQEADAIPAYERALQLGLEDEHLPRALLQLGSSLRNVGKHVQAVALLEEACRRFPDHAPLRVFLALARWSAGQPRAALIELLELTRQALHTPEMVAYGRAIDAYIAELKAEATP